MSGSVIITSSDVIITKLSTKKIKKERHIALAKEEGI